LNYTPAEVADMSLWEFHCITTGARKARGEAEKVRAPTDAEHLEAQRRLAAMQRRMQEKKVRTNGNR